ncbi:MAG: sigma-54-dependent Fis family transcriptional regulator [Sedimentisphaerales bacterium]|nr:sigma-54-dependent Fis family transcriptional regulator [Sedimentisphaerales bacterium]
MNLDNIDILIVDKGQDLAGQVRSIFTKQKINIKTERNIDRVLDYFESRTFDIVLVTGVTYNTGKMNGEDILEILSDSSPLTQILFLVEKEDIETAMSALKAGAYQYSKLPISDKELNLLIETAIEKRPVYGKNLLLKNSKEGKAKFENIIGQSPAMRNVFKQIQQAAATDISVLLLGETGTGKDLAAQAIHQQSARHGGPYVPVNLGALPTELVASELFGHEKGAFTGATEQRIGKFEQAGNGTIFLDEIDAIDEKVQVSLLRLIEKQKFQRVGSSKLISGNARIIAATNQNLEEAVTKGIFRKDLFYRLEVFRIDIPPLRQRGDDICLLIEEFIKRYNNNFQKNILDVSPETIEMLKTYPWPGNVREMKNAIQRAVLVCTDEILRPEHFHARFQSPPRQEPMIEIKLGTPLEKIEKEVIIRALEESDDNRTQAAKTLGISRRGLYKKMDKHNID